MHNPTWEWGIVLLAMGACCWLGCPSQTSGDDDDDDIADDDTSGGDDDVGDDDTGTIPEFSWVPIPGGTYDMGEENGESANEPVHSVTIADFAMLKTEVTVAQYAACFDDGVCGEPGVDEYFGTWNEPGQEEHPINGVDWFQAVDFCAWIGGRLPSEAEWEYAARNGGQDTTYPWGEEEATCDHAVMQDEGVYGCGLSETGPVCSKSPAGDTVHGLCDMAGNVAEWLQDWSHGCYDCADCPNYFCDSSTAAPDDGSAWEVPEGHARINRGGHFGSLYFNTRTFARFENDPGGNHYWTGIRCVR